MTTRTSFTGALRNERRRIVRRIRRLIAPHLKKTGYREYIDRRKGIMGGTRPAYYYVPAAALSVGGFILDDVLAVGMNKIITDAHGGGASTASFGSFPIEDLTKLCHQLDKTLAAPANGQT